MSRHTCSSQQPCCAAGCCSLVGRREFLAGLGLMGGAALAMDWFGSAVSQAMGAAPRTGPGAKPRVCVAFSRGRDEYYMGWPGAAFDHKASQALYTETLQKAAARLGVELDVQGEPLRDTNAAGTFLEKTTEAKADGVLLVVMNLNDGWPMIHHFLKHREQPKDLPTVVFAPQGTQFTPTLQAFREMPHVFVGATQDVEWLGTGLRMLKTIWQMATTRVAVVHGDQEREQPLAPLGTVLHHVPLERFAEAYDATAEAAEAKDIAAAFRKCAKDCVEPDEGEILEAARTYVANRRLMEAAGCQAVTMDCLGLVGRRRTPPPCMAYMQLLNEGTCGACERDITATLSLLLSSYLLDRPAFLHNPSPNTVRNTYVGAHCTAPTKMDGFDQPDSEYVLRSHHESDWGVAPQVLLREGQAVTMMKFLNPGELMACTGTLLGNIHTRPDDGVGGCRTAFEMAVDDVADTRDIRGHHNVLIYGKHLPMLDAYCQLAGLGISHIAGGPVRR